MLYQVEPLPDNGSEGRTWTDTDITARGILSPLRLPISPPRHKYMVAPGRFELPECHSQSVVPYRLAKGQ